MTYGFYVIDSLRDSTVLRPPTDAPNMYMARTARTALTLLVALASSIISHAMDTVTVLASSQQLIVSQHGVPLNSTDLYNIDYAEIYPEYCGGVMKLNNTIATTASLIFNGIAIEVTYVLTSIGGDAMIYLDGRYQETFNSHSVDNSCSLGHTNITNLPQKPHNITVVNANVLNATFLSSFTYTPYSEIASTNVVRAPSQSAPVPVSLSDMATLQPSSTPASALSNSKASKGSIVGGVIGGFIVLIVALLITYIIRRRPRISTLSRASVRFDYASSVESEKQDFSPHDSSTIP
ncbi:hypothetical protein FRB94_006508 [Tulasnella sp. JGI-2019a]|nr:hypothetical protein FRB93_009271 [Tulasnella sp. JGI-2019a]KAG8982544.1 hypothetical protein FRB94_006508 [Tulasnella sp. JGI-2019a]KAG9025557.1 hypothetical protein FRB95_010061 [Tulasnella sp. JGI-2019a]